MVLAAAYTHQKEAFLAHLESFGVETRPIISGNFMRQPVCRLGSEETSPLGCGKRALTERAEDLPGAEVVHLSGLYIGLPPLAMTQDDVDLLADAIMSFKFQRRHVVQIQECVRLGARQPRSVRESRMGALMPYPAHAHPRMPTRSLPPGRACRLRP